MQLLKDLPCPVWQPACSRMMIRQLTESTRKLTSAGNASGAHAQHANGSPILTGWRLILRQRVHLPPPERRKFYELSCRKCESVLRMR